MRYDRAGPPAKNGLGVTPSTTFPLWPPEDHRRARRKSTHPHLPTPPMLAQADGVSKAETSVATPREFRPAVLLS